MYNRKLGKDWIKDREKEIELNRFLRKPKG